MAVPNMLHVVESAKELYPQDWKDAHTGNANTEGFIRKLAPMLHAEYEEFGLNGKRGDPNDISDDAINWKGEGADTDPTNNNSPVTVIDVIGGAGGPSPYPTWAIVTNPSAPVKAAWVEPGDIEEPEVPESEDNSIPWIPYPGDESNAELKRVLSFDYSRRPQSADFDVSVWAFRVMYTGLMGLRKPSDGGEPLGINAAITHHRPEWCGALGVPVIPVPPDWVG